MILTWHDEQWRTLFRDGLDSLSRLPHALLLSGSPGLGKVHFADALASLLLCESPRLRGQIPEACGQCQGCHWLAGENHPDYRRLAPEGEDEEDGEGVRKEKKRGARQIRIDSVRELEDFVFVGSHRHGNRVVVINSADSMNSAAANALLKVLEEPPASVYFILITNHYRRLLPTIRSRTRVLAFQRPDAGVATAWLKSRGVQARFEQYLPLAGGAPLTVVAWQKEDQLGPLEALSETLASVPADPLALAAQWDGLMRRHAQFSMEMLVEGVQRWMHDLALLAAALPPRFFPDLRVPSGIQLSEPKLATAWRDILRFRRSARHPLNQLLFLEDLAAHTMRALGRSGA
jgi:DNA polymerase-3 subunit delta'